MTRLALLVAILTASVGHTALLDPAQLASVALVVGLVVTAWVVACAYEPVHVLLFTAHATGSNRASQPVAAVADCRSVVNRR